MVLFIQQWFLIFTGPVFIGLSFGTNKFHKTLIMILSLKPTCFLCFVLLPIVPEAQHFINST